jgi:hypothetical protein
MTLKYDEEKTRELSEFEICRTYWDFDVTDYSFNQSAVPGEMKKRGLSGENCIDALLAEHGVDLFCSRYNRAALRGEPSALIGFATRISRPALKQGLEARNLNCYTDDDVAKSANREDPSKSRVTEAFGSITKSIERRRSSSTSTCRETIYDTVECKSSSY